MRISELNRTKVPIIATDKSLNKYQGVVVFPEKVAKANEMLKNIGLPSRKKRISKRAA